MEKSKCKNGRLLKVICLLGLTISSHNIVTYFEYDNLCNEKETQMKSTIVTNENIIKEKETTIESLKQEIKAYKNLDEEISDEKAKYYASLKEFEDAVANGTIKKKIAYLTFDDGPYYNTYKVLNILDKYNVKATFFTTNVNGDKCYDNRSKNCHVLYSEYVKRGHTIANHTYTHGIFSGLYKSTSSFMDAVIKQEELVKKETGGYITNIVRFPGGSPSAGSKKNSIISELRKRNYGWVDWTASDGDGGNLKSKSQAWTNFTSSIGSKYEVILLHDYDSITTSILPDIIKYLEKNNYVLLPLFYESRVINK